MGKGHGHRIVAAALIGILSLPVCPSSRLWPKKKKTSPDSTTEVAKSTEVKNTRKMVTSSFPVRIQVTVNAIQIYSEHSQILPIYTASGAFYMATRVNKGVTWINGLPRGRYFINNKPVTIK